MIHHYQVSVCTRLLLFGVCTSGSLGRGDPPLSVLCLCQTAVVVWYWYLGLAAGLGEGDSPLSGLNCVCVPDCCCLVFAGLAVLAEVIHHYQSCVCARLLLFGVVRSGSPDGVDPPSYKDLCLCVRLAVHVLAGPTVLTEVIHHIRLESVPDCCCLVFVGLTVLTEVIHHIRLVFVCQTAVVVWYRYLGLAAGLGEGDSPLSGLSCVCVPDCCCAVWCFQVWQSWPR